MNTHMPITRKDEHNNKTSDEKYFFNEVIYFFTTLSWGAIADAFIVRFSPSRSGIIKT